MCTTEIAKYTKIEQKEATAGTCGADADEDRGRKRVGMPRGDRVDRNPVAHSPFGGVERGEGGGGRAARQPRRSETEMRSRIGL